MGISRVGVARVDLVAKTATFDAGMKRAGRSMRGFRNEAKLGTSALAMFGRHLSGLAIAYGMLRAARSTEQFTQAMQSSLAIMRVTNETRERMSKTARQVAYDTMFSSTEIAKAYYYLASAGLDVEQSLKAMPIVARFAQAGMFDLSKATSLLTGSQKALGLASADAAKNQKSLIHVGDVLVKANQLADASVEQFAEALTNKSAAALKTANKSMEEGVAVLAVYAELQRKGADAGTALTIVLRDLQRTALTNPKGFREAGIAIFDATGQMRKMWDVVRDLENALGKLTPKAGTKLLMDLGFPAKSLAYLQMLIGTSGRMEEFYKKLMKAGNAMDDVANKQLTPFNKAWQKLGATWDALKESEIAPLIEGLGNVLDSMIPKVEKAEKKWGAFRDTLFSIGSGLKMLPKLAADYDPTLLGMAARYNRKWAESQNRNARDLLFYRELDKHYVGPTLKAERDAIWAAKNKKADMTKSVPLPAPFDPFSATEKDKSAAATLIKGLRTPMEIFRDSVKDLMKLEMVGAIGKDTVARGMLKAREEFISSLPSALTGGGAGSAVQYGTQAHYAAEAQARAQEVNQQYLASLVREAINGNRLQEEVLAELRKRKEDGDEL
jgi:TP901 family phage tail tape measure protein